MIEFDKIITVVGTERRMIDAQTFFSAWNELTEFYQSEGLEGDELDHAVCDALPIRLLEIIGDRAKPH